MSTGSTWYSLHRNSVYPLLPAATGQDAEGNVLPPEILCDLRMRFVGNLDTVAYISAAGIDDEGVGIVFSADDRMIGAVHAPISELHQGRKIFRITPIDPEVQGFAVVSIRGDTPRRRYSFTGPEQTGLSPRAATPFVSNRTSARLARDGFVPLVGPVVYLRGEDDIQVTQEIRLLGNQLQEATVLSLRERSSRVSLTEIRTSATDYGTGCGTRPESLTCGDPVPVQSIDQVLPDCCGRIYVEIRGCGELQSLDNGSGAVLVCDTRVEEICPQPNLPDRDGNLPSDTPVEGDCVKTTPQDSQGLRD